MIELILSILPSRNLSLANQVAFGIVLVVVSAIGEQLIVEADDIVTADPISIVVVGERFVRRDIAVGCQQLARIVKGVVSRVSVSRLSNQLPGQVKRELVVRNGNTLGIRVNDAGKPAQLIERLSRLADPIAESQTIKPVNARYEPPPVVAVLNAGIINFTTGPIDRLEQVSCVITLLDGHSKIVLDLSQVAERIISIVEREIRKNRDSNVTDTGIPIEQIVCVAITKFSSSCRQ